MTKKRKVRIIKQPTMKQLELSDKQKAALEALFRWERDSAKSKKIIGCCV
jgi:hypothetical protein